LLASRVVRVAGPRIPRRVRAWRGIASRQEKTVKKKDKKETKEKKAQRHESIVRDWQPLFAAMKDVIDWALDIAVALSLDTPEDVESIEDVRACFHAWLEGRPCDMKLTDLLLTFGTILSAIELDLGIDSVDLLAPLRAILTAPSTLPHVMRFPGVERRTERTVVIRRCPGAQRSCGYDAAPTQFAA
jgi:hypothetical protein